MSIIIKRKESKEAEKSVDVFERLSRLCQQLGGKVEDMRPDFGCVVNPEKVISSLKEFESLMEEIRRGRFVGVAGIWFGDHDFYFAVYPGMSFVGFVLAYDLLGVPREDGNKFLKELASEFRNFMIKKDLKKVKYQIDYRGSHINITTMVPLTKEGLSNLLDIGRAILEFKPKLQELIKKYNMEPRAPPKFML